MDNKRSGEMTLTVRSGKEHGEMTPVPEAYPHINRLSILKCLQLPILGNDLGRWYFINNDFCLTTLINAIKSNGNEEVSEKHKKARHSYWNIEWMELMEGGRNRG